ncbi:hypothetical protein Rhopal_000448-T1 [Rhodotorula paludigena]|uniref:Alpha-ketoglutarate-dependent dioxygenase AlkB-like domain-containing protein n=1 Tax=Rhodotorula paludigena TaxID=86838 RepID=A0AAV5GDS5_9BASI|nr:hypothetical protein Rhopal_000448-T1 [Rhodotorula paludigena]
MPGADSDSDLSDLSDLERAWNLQPSPTPPPRPQPVRALATASAALEQPRTSRSTKKRNDAPASAPDSGSRPSRRDSSSRRIPAPPASGTPAQLAKRLRNAHRALKKSRREDQAVQEAFADDDSDVEHIRVTGASSAGRAERGRKRGHVDEESAHPVVAKADARKAAKKRSKKRSSGSTVSAEVQRLESGTDAATNGSISSAGRRSRPGAAKAATAVAQSLSARSSFAPSLSRDVVRLQKDFFAARLNPSASSSDPSLDSRRTRGSVKPRAVSPELFPPAPPPPRAISPELLPPAPSTAVAPAIVAPVKAAAPSKLPREARELARDYFAAARDPQRGEGPLPRTRQKRAVQVSPSEVRESEEGRRDEVRERKKAKRAERKAAQRALHPVIEPVLPSLAVEAPAVPLPAVGAAAPTPAAIVPTRPPSSRSIRLPSRYVDDPAPAPVQAPRPRASLPSLDSLGLLLPPPARGEKRPRKTGEGSEAPLEGFLTRAPLDAEALEERRRKKREKKEKKRKERMREEQERATLDLGGVILPPLPSCKPVNPTPIFVSDPSVGHAAFAPRPALPLLPVTTPASAASTSLPSRAAPSKPTTSTYVRPHKPRTRHPALDSRVTWVPLDTAIAAAPRITREGRPPIWCEGRQELCESLEYFRSYQGGHYDSQERCLGYLLDGFPSPNDRCEHRGRIIISHGGGCSEVVPPPSSSSAAAAVAGPTSYRLRASQERSNLRMRSLLNCRDTQTPVVLLAGSSYEFFPRLGHMGGGGVRYAVLGHYLVTDVWAEGEPVEGSEDGKYHVRFKVRFEWVASQGTPWFDSVIGKDGVLPGHAQLAALHETGPSQADSTAVSSPIPMSTPPRDGSLPDSEALDVVSPAPGSSPLPASESGTVDSGFFDGPTDLDDDERSDMLETVKCGRCGTTHRRVYQEDIECYNEECDWFFLIDGVMPRPSDVTYSPSLLSPTPSLPHLTHVPQPVQPKTLQALAGSSRISDYSWEAWRGFGCEECGRLSSRGDWSRLKCAGCSAETDARGKIFSAADLKKDNDAMSQGRTVDPFMPVFLDPSYSLAILADHPDYEGYTVDLLPPVDGVAKGVARVHHLWPKTASARKEADRLFEEYQGDEAGKLFKRNKLTRHHSAGALLCQQFTFNAGEHYKHAINAATYPFAPSTSAATSEPAGSDSAPADEPEKKPTYAPACARDARDHLKSVVGMVVGESEQTAFNEILSVAYMTGGKMNYHDDGERGLGPYVASVSLGSDAVMSFRVKNKAKRGPRSRRESDSAQGDEADDEATASKWRSRVALKVRLSHGHILIMEGADMQKLFEHKVVPEGLRFGTPGIAYRQRSYLRAEIASTTCPTLHDRATHATQQVKPAVQCLQPAWTRPPVKPSHPSFPVHSSFLLARRAELNTPRSHPRGNNLPAPQYLDTRPTSLAHAQADEWARSLPTKPVDSQGALTRPKAAPVALVPSPMPPDAASYPRWTASTPGQSQQQQHQQQQQQALNDAAWTRLAMLNVQQTFAAFCATLNQ